MQDDEERNGQPETLQMSGAIIILCSSNIMAPHILWFNLCFPKSKFNNNRYRGAGIYRDKTMADTLMYILNDDTQNYTFCRSKLVVEPFEHST